MPELQGPKGVEQRHCPDQRRTGEIVDAHHQAWLVAVQESPQQGAGDDPWQLEAEDDKSDRRARSRQLQYEPEQGDSGELIAQVRDAQAQPQALKCRAAQWSAESNASSHERVLPSPIRS